MSRDILLTEIDRDPEQPRQHFDAGALQELADSLAATGQAVPITVRPVGDRYMIVQGERRYRAAQLLGWATIRAEVQDIDAGAAQWLTLVENIQRADLTPIEEAQAYQKLIAAGATQTEIAKRIGKTQSYIAQKLRLLKLPTEVQAMLDDGRLTEGHARQLLRLYCHAHDPGTRLFRMAEEAAAGAWSVRRLTLEVNYEQMTHDGYWLLPIDDRWTFKDLAALEKVFGENSPDHEPKRHLQVQARIGMILKWSEVIWNAGAWEIAKDLLEKWPLADVYWWTKQCAEWERRYAQEDVDVFAYLRYVWLGIASPDAVSTRVRAKIESIPADADADQVWAGMAEVIKGIDRDFASLFKAVKHDLQTA